MDLLVITEQGWDNKEKLETGWNNKVSKYDLSVDVKNILSMITVICVLFLLFESCNSLDVLYGLTTMD